MPNRAPLTAKAEELLLELELVARREQSERIRELAEAARRVFGEMDRERLDFIYALNHGDHNRHTA